MVIFSFSFDRMRSALRQLLCGRSVMTSFGRRAERPGTWLPFDSKEEIALFFPFRGTAPIVFLDFFDGGCSARVTGVLSSRAWKSSSSSSWYKR